MNILELKAECVRNNYTFESLSAVLGINKVTLHRKLHGESSFTRDEMQLIKTTLNLSDEMFLKIFFN